MAKVYTEEVDIERVKVDIKSGEVDIESTKVDIPVSYTHLTLPTKRIV